MAALEHQLAQLAPTSADALGEPPALVIGGMYERHHRMVRALCQLLLRNSADAEDAAQQTFLSAYASLIDGTAPRNPAAWLATIARRECWARTAQRRHQPLQLDETTEAEWRAGSALDAAVRNADLTALWKAINELPRQQRAAFLLREFSGLSYAEVAEALGASESAIESLLVRARRQLRDGLEPAVKAANLALTPLLLLRDRLTRMLHSHAAGGAAGKAALIPATVKIGAAVAGSVAVAAGSVQAGIQTFHSRNQKAVVSAGRPGSGGDALAVLLGRTSVADPFPTAYSVRAGANASRPPRAGRPGAASAESPVAPPSSSPAGNQVVPPGAAPAEPQPAGGVAAPNVSSGSAPADTQTPAGTTTHDGQTAPTDSPATGQTGSGDTQAAPSSPGTTTATSTDTGSPSLAPTDTTTATTNATAINPTTTDAPVTVPPPADPTAQNGSAGS